MARCFWAVGLPMLLGGLGTVAYGVLCVVVAAYEHVDTAAGLEIYGTQLTKGTLLVTGGVFACMVGGHVCRAAWRHGSSSRLAHVLLVGGYLLVVGGLVVFTMHASIAGFYGGFGIQVAGAVAVGIGGSMVQGDRHPRPLSDWPTRGLPAIGGRYVDKVPRGGSDAIPPG